MTETGRLLKKIASTRSVNTLPTLMRAFGCAISARAVMYTKHDELIAGIQRVERDALAIERCTNISEARAYLRLNGWMTPRKTAVGILVDHGVAALASEVR